AFVWHRRRAAAPLARGLEHLADFGLHQERDVAGDLSGGTDQNAGGARNIRDSITLRMPGRIETKIKLFSETLRDPLALFSQGGECAGGTAELQNSGLRRGLVQIFARARDE